MPSIWYCGRECLLPESVDRWGQCLVLESASGWVHPGTCRCWVLAHIPQYSHALTSHSFPHRGAVGLELSGHWCAGLSSGALVKAVSPVGLSKTAFSVGDKCWNYSASLLVGFPHCFLSLCSSLSPLFLCYVPLCLIDFTH